jgi:hypothetical protein
MPTSAPVRFSTITLSTPGAWAGCIDVLLQRHLLAAAQAFIGGEDDAAAAILTRPASASG